MPPSLSGKRKAPDSLQEWEEKRKKQKLERIDAAETRDYAGVVAVTITWEDHDFPVAAYKKELHDLESGLFENCFGVTKCERVVIPADCGDAETYVWQAIRDFKQRHVDKNCLQLIYYAGHGGEGNSQDAAAGPVLRATSKRSKGQSFKLNSLLWNSMFMGEDDTVVLLDCCYAELAIRSSLSGCKDVFGACAETRFTLGPGPQSFTTLLIQAFQVLCAKEGSPWSSLSFSMDKWARITAELASDQHHELPIHQSFGETKFQILFQPDLWMRRKRRRQFLRREQVAKILREIWREEDLGTECPINPDEIASIESDPALTESLSALKVFEAYLRMRDARQREIEGAIKRRLCNVDFEPFDDDDRAPRPSFGKLPGLQVLRLHIM